MHIYLFNLWLMFRMDTKLYVLLTAAMKLLLKLQFLYENFSCTLAYCRNKSFFAFLCVTRSNTKDLDDENMLNKLHVSYDTYYSFYIFDICFACNL